MNKIRIQREKLGYTQVELAEKANISVRTIQRIESGRTIPKGYTLKVLAEALEIGQKELLIEKISTNNTSAEVNWKLKLINLSALCFLAIPFGNILIPIFLWNKYKANPKVNEIGRRIINFQVLWTLSSCLLLIVSPFLQDLFPLNFTLILNVGLLAICVNIFVIVKTALSLSREEYDILPLKLQLL